jgi:hypothetical protein
MYAEMILVLTSPAQTNNQGLHVFDPLNNNVRNKAVPKVFAAWLDANPNMPPR